MYKIYIVLSHTGTLISKYIKLYTKTKYSHVSISFDSDLKHLYSFGRRSIRNPLNGGFVKEGRNQGIYRHYKNTICSVYEVEVSEDNYYNAKKLIKHFEEHEDQLRYNILGLFTIMFGYPLSRNNYYFCSQFVAEVLDKAGIIHFNKDYSLIKPIDFYNRDDQFKLIYNGKLSSYRPNLTYTEQMSYQQVNQELYQ